MIPSFIWEGGLLEGVFYCRGHSTRGFYDNRCEDAVKSLGRSKGLLMAHVDTLIARRRVYADSNQLGT